MRWWEGTSERARLQGLARTRRERRRRRGAVAAISPAVGAIVLLRSARPASRVGEAGQALGGPGAIAAGLHRGNKEGGDREGEPRHWSKGAVRAPSGCGGVQRRRKVATVTVSVVMTCMPGCARLQAQRGPRRSRTCPLGSRGRASTPRPTQRRRALTAEPVQASAALFSFAKAVVSPAQRPTHAPSQRPVAGPERRPPPWTMTAPASSTARSSTRRP